ncbi:hypothetical protein [Nostoc sp.]|uniref:hypothetical protein n=1 Tax=Nostoc sp. TaxID=1180 RepID=UPI002FF6FDD3
MKPTFTFSIIGGTLLVLLMPNLLVAQTNDYGTTRRPATCPSRTKPKTGAPSVEQAKMYFICDYEGLGGIQGERGSYMWLVGDINIEVAPVSRRFTPNDLPFNNRNGGTQLGMDPDKPVYDIRGSYTSYSCFNWPDKVGRNCDVDYFSDSTGICFLDTFGGWHCRMIGGQMKSERNVPPPTN